MKMKKNEKKRRRKKEQKKTKTHNFKNKDAYLQERSPQKMKTNTQILGELVNLAVMSTCVVKPCFHISLTM